MNKPISTIIVGINGSATPNNAAPPKANAIMPMNRLNLFRDMPKVVLAMLTAIRMMPALKATMGMMSPV
jgi:hypothetical protein